MKALNVRVWADFMDAYLAKGTNQVVFFHLEANTIEITHGYVDVTGMNPPFVGMKWSPLREEPRNNQRSVLQVFRALNPTKVREGWD